MRCRMRCGDIWRCGGPIKKYVPVESIGIEGRTQEMTFDSQVPPYSVTYSINISPSDATKKDVRIESNNPSVISVDSIESGQVTFTIHSEGEARVRITSLADADISDEYGVTITAPSQQFSPNNGIFVDVDTEGTSTGRKRKTKATAMGDRFTARVFILKEESEDYVLLEWVHGGDVSKTYVGAANETHTRAMFTEETTDKLAREIETLWDDGQIVNGFVKFTDETWGAVEQFYSTPLTSESIEELQETLASDDIVTLPETYFDDITVLCDSKYDDISGGVGDSKNIEWRGIPEASGTHDPIMFEIGDESMVSITDVQIHPDDGQYSEYYTGMINFLKKGETTITFYSVNNPRGTLKEVHIIVTSTGAYYYINLHQDEFPGNVEVGQTTICKAEVENYRENDTLAASDYDDSIAQITFQRKAGGHGGWRSNWDIHITGLQAGETVARIHSVNDPEVYEDLLITVSEPIPPVPVESIGAPSIDTIDTQEYRNPQEITFSYLPIDADDMSNIVFNSTNSKVARIIDAGARKTRYENGICTFYIKPGEAGTATVSYSLGGTTYNVYVHVTAPQTYTITVETEAKPENTVINYCINGTWTEEAPESDFPMTLDFSEPISLSYQSEVIYCGAVLDNENYQFWGTYENNSVHIEMNGEPLSNGDAITIDSDTTLKFVWDPPAPERCPASIQAVWGNDATIEVGQTAAVITNFTTTAECENVDYSNIVATPSNNIVTTNVDINDRKVYVTGVSAGQCTITFSDGDNSWTFNVTVQAPAVQSIEDFGDAYVLYGETMNVYVDILPLDASYSTADFNLTFTDGGGNVVQNPPVTADVVSIINVEGHVAGIGIEVIGGQTTGDVYMIVEYTPSQGAISGGGWIHVGPAATALSDIEPLQIRVGELGSYRVGGLTPSDALTKGITVTSSDDSVVSVGLLYNDLGSLLVDLEGLSAGEATLTITLTNGAEYENTVTVVDRWQTVVETMHGGIYHNAEDGIYYLTDAEGNNQIAISDINLNATGLWDPNDWDDSGTYGTWGGKYQWGNNYDFNLEHTTSHEQVDASAYGPSNPYNVDVLITPENQGNYYFWDSSSNINLWGYDDYESSGGEVTYMQGPCSEGWHVPSREELTLLLSLWSYIRTGSTSAPDDTTLMSSDLLLPMYDDGWGLLRANYLNVGDTIIPVGFVWGSQMTGFGMLQEDTYNIRPFKDELPEDLPEWNASGDTCYAELQYVIDEISLETPYQVSGTIQYDGCENVDPTNITTSSDDENVAVAEIRFDTNGATLIIHSVAPGTCTVTTTDGNNSFTTDVTVTAPTPPTYATISSGSENVTMAPGDNVVKRISFSPSDADTSNITWANSDSNVANGSQQLLLEGMCDTAIDANSEGTCTVTVSDGTNSYVYNVTVVGAEPEQGYTFTINVENLPKGADIDGEIMDAGTGETLEKISVSSFPMTIDILPPRVIELSCSPYEGNGSVTIGSYKEEGVGNDYEINLNCYGYKPLFEAVGFDLEDDGGGAYTCTIDTNELDSNVSLTISFTPVE